MCYILNVVVFFIRTGRGVLPPVDLAEVGDAPLGGSGSSACGGAPLPTQTVGVGVRELFFEWGGCSCRVAASVATHVGNGVLRFFTTDVWL